MYCKNCGKEMIENSQYCEKCGQSVDGKVISKRGEVDESTTLYNVLAFLIPIVGLVLALVWMDDFPKRSKAMIKWMLIGIVVGIAVLVITILLMILVVSATI